MNVIFNILVFSVFIRWFWKQYIINQRKSFIGIVLLYLLTSILVFAFSIYTQNDYLDGVHYLISGGIFISMYWIISSAIIVRKNVKEKTTQRIYLELLQVIPLLLIPLFIYVLLSSMTLKIGG